MNGQPVQSGNPIILTKHPFNWINKQVIIYIGILLLGILLGFGAKTIINPQKTNLPLSSKPVIDESKLPVSLALLTNPIVYEWRGSVKGKVTKKDDHTFTLVDDKGNNITIIDKMPSGDIFKAMFFDKTNINKQLSLKDIPLNTILLGDFFIFKGGPNTPVGSSFIKQ